MHNHPYDSGRGRGCQWVRGGRTPPAAARAPRSRDRRVDRRRQRRHDAGRAPPAPVPLADRARSRRPPPMLAGHDVVFLALPHGTSAAHRRPARPDTLVVDCGADHRLADPAAWNRWYGGDPRRAAGPTACPNCPAPREAASRAPSGSRSPAATRPSPPSRWPPRSPPDLIEPDVVVVAVSGTSGAGRGAQSRTCSAPR